MILELLPELGVTDKKTHSSSLDDDVALEVRRRLTGKGGAASAEGYSDEDTHADHSKPEREHYATETAVLEEPETSHPQHATRVEPMPKVEPPAAEAPKESEESAPARPMHPLRPPLASQMTGTVPPPHVAHAPAAPVTPPISRGSTIPAKPVPSPRPGQILSGPRQPLPPGVSDLLKPSPTVAIPGAPRPAAVPSIPTPRPAPRPGVSASPAQPSQPAAPVGGGGPLRPPAKPNLAGQPAARPVVPPRPDMVARLAQAAGSRRSGDASSGDADQSSGEPGARTSDLYRSGASRPAIDARTWWSWRSAVRPSRNAWTRAVRCIRRRHCAPNRRRCRPIPGAVMRPSPAARGPAPRRGSGRGSSTAGIAPSGSVPTAAHRSRNHHRRRHHGEGAFRKARHQGQPGGQAAGGEENSRDHQPDARRQAGRRAGARFRRVHQQGQLRRRDHAGHSTDRGRPGSREASAGGHHHGPRRSRQDVAARCDSFGERRRA